MKTPIEYIKEAWAIYLKKENFIFFARIMVVLVTISTIISYSHTYISQFVMNTKPVGINFENLPLSILFILIGISSFLFYFYSHATTNLAILRMGEPEKEIFIKGYGVMWRFFLISLVLGLIIGLSALLLIVPAVIFGIWYSFSPLLVLDKGLNIKEALKKSKLMVKDKFWKVLGRYFVFGLLSFVISFLLISIPYVGQLLTLFIAPLFILPSYLLYKDLIVVD